MIPFRLCYFLLILPLSMRASPPADTSINGIKIQFDYSLAIFPASWQVAPISARGEPMATSEIGRTKLVMAGALHKYPVTALKQDLLNVYFVRSMRFFDAPYGGTNSSDAVYISNDGEKAGYSNYFLEQTFHHELSSILFRNHMALLDTTEWKKTNLAGFDYNDPENGVGSIRKNQTSQSVDTLLCLEGFLTQYSLSSMENDINTFAQNIFCPAPDFWKAVEKYPRIARKTKLLIAFYHNIDPQFTEEYFKKFRPNK